MRVSEFCSNLPVIDSDLLELFESHGLVRLQSVRQLLVVAALIHVPCLHPAAAAAAASSSQFYGGSHPSLSCITAPSTPECGSDNRL